jgi:predicted SAM-dependent methyltransferase
VSEPIKLHLGCGSIHLDGWINIDRRYQPGVDEVGNIGILQHYPAGGVEAIYSCHALDHFDRWTYKHVLRRWFDLLKPDCVLQLSLPDFWWAADQYAAGVGLDHLFGQLYAGQDYPDNVRHWAWDFAQACKDLSGVGFARVERVMVPFCDFDASAIRDSAGRLRSLNVNAYKAP